MNKKYIENNEKITKDEMYSFDSSLEFKEYESIKLNKINSPTDKIYNFISLSNDKNKSKEKKEKEKRDKKDKIDKKESQMLSDFLLSKKNKKNYANIKQLKVITSNKNKFGINTPLSSFSGYNTSRCNEKKFNSQLNLINERGKEVSFQYNKFNKFGLPILNINNNILLKLKNSINCHNIRKISLSPRIQKGYKKHYGNEEKCPICISLSMKQQYLKSKKQFLFNNTTKERISENKRINNINEYLINLKKKKFIKNYILNNLK